MSWEDLSARAKGLGTHLVPDPVLEELSRASDLAALAARLADLGFPVAPEGNITAGELELAARREAARRLRILGRWLGDRAATLAVFFDDEDHRSIRALIRGAMAGTPREARLSGLIPTPTLPERALEELAGQATPAEIAAHLLVWDHPFGGPLLPVSGGEPPELARMELALYHAFGERARAGARRGGRVLREFVAETIDLLNLEAGLLLAGGGQEIPIDDGFLGGGRVLTREAFGRAAGSADRGVAWRVMGGLFRATALGAVFRASEPPVRFEGALLRLRIGAWHRKGRLAPQSGAGVIEYLLRLRLQVLAIREVLWGVELGVPLDLRAAVGPSR